MNKPRKNILGKSFNRLTVIKQVEDYFPPNSRIGQTKYLCLCSCGNKTVLTVSNLVSGATKSCGCLKKELSKPYGFKALYPELYTKYKSAKSRCNNPNNNNFKNYGARGIKFLFSNGYVDFAKYALDNGWKPGLQIDRINNDGHYEKGNIRFVDSITNQSNRAITVFITAFKETKPISEWIRDSRCLTSGPSLRRRIHNGWNPELALTAKPHSHLKSILKQNSATPPLVIPSGVSDTI